MRRIVMVVCAALIFVPLYVRSRPGQNVSAGSAFCITTSGRLLIKVSGDVHNPGIYNVPATLLAHDVIKMANPVNARGQLADNIDAITLLRNGSSILLKSQSNGINQLTVDVMTVPERIILGIPLDVSQMSEADFIFLPGIGHALAARIVAYRQKNGDLLKVDDLASVEGLGEKKVEIIRKYVQPSVNNR